MPDHFVLWKSCLLCWAMVTSALWLAWFFSPSWLPPHISKMAFPCPAFTPYILSLAPWLPPAHPSCLLPLLLIPAACLCKLEMMYCSSKCSQVICCGIIWTAVNVRGNVNMLLYHPLRRSAEAGSEGTAYMTQWLMKDELTLARKLSSYMHV